MITTVMVFAQIVNIECMKREGNKMKKILITILILGFFIFSGCVNEELENWKRIQVEGIDNFLNETKGRDKLRENTNFTCIYNTCLDECGINRTLSYNPLDYDNNKDGKIDDFEWEVIKSLQERKRECNSGCIDLWEFMDKCRFNKNNKEND